MLNQVDDASLEAAVRAAERCARLTGSEALTDLTTAPPTWEYLRPAIWSDATYDLTTEARGEVARRVTDAAEAKQMLAAGYLEMRGFSGAAFSSRDARGMFYTALTQAQCSMTVRDAGGTGSGWAGLSSYDWARIDPGALAERALEKAIASRNPVALEPGRYTVILEPQAVHDLVSLVIVALPREHAEQGVGPFALQGGDSKLGLKVVDERITIELDPMDPQLGVMPFIIGEREPVRALKWIDRGVLMNLDADRGYYLPRVNENLPTNNPYAFRMSGGDTSVEEMIRTTKRGLLVTRFSNIRELDGNSLLATGLTRDGLWLIENGKISKAVKNFRFTESPMFVLNSIEQLGVPVPVFRPVKDAAIGDDAHRIGLIPAVVPPVKARDFSFTSTIDAI